MSGKYAKFDEKNPWLEEQDNIDDTVDVEKGFGLDDEIEEDFGAGRSAGQKSGGQEKEVQRSCQCRHPVAAFFHMFFRSAALATYMFGSIFTDSFVMIFITVVLLLCFDFWTVKNVSGRLLVGLRWWNEVKEDGTSEWYFEAAKNPESLDPVDSKVFWLSLYVFPAVWILFGITSILRLSVSWSLLVGVAIALNVANVIGYTKCRKDAKQKVKGFIAGEVMKRATQAMMES